MQAQILEWGSVASTQWTYAFRQKQVTCLAYRVDKLPDFTDHRFAYLGKEEDERPLEVLRRQQAMIRQFHSLGPEWTISLRLLHEGEQVTLYLLFRHASVSGLPAERLANARGTIRNALMNREYTFHEVDDPQEMGRALDASWAQEAAEVTKRETEYQGDAYPVPGMTAQQFYVPYTWTPADNTMEAICSALMNHRGRAVVEVTLLPAEYLQEEKDWVGVNLRRLKECMNGETIRSEKGKVLWTGRKLPGLKTPIDNYEKMNKQYEASRLFLASIRVFADQDIAPLASAFMTGSVKTEGRIQTFRAGFRRFDYLLSCYANVDVSADAHTPYWNQHAADAPFRAQRLARLNSLEEISCFFRIPVPERPGFPGFGFDTGIESGGQAKRPRSEITLGRYLDVEGRQDLPARFDSQQLAKHGLIVGVPGSGKTTAMFNILYQLWDVPQEQKIPFIVLEPAKTEYRALKTLELFRDDLLVFTLGDEGVSPFRFNPLEVLPGIKIERHISMLQACFVGAFDLFDPLPIFLEQAIRRTYREKGWYDDSKGGDPGLETPTLSDLCRNAEYIVSHSGFDAKMKSDFQASLLERLNSLRSGSKGRMLDTGRTIPMQELMQRPVVLELDSLNGDEKSLMMMFLLSYVFEYCKAMRKSGSPLQHMLLVEEAHNLIPSSGSSSDSRANPREHTIELFVNMLAEMRALGQGILIADQLPTAIAPQAVKQTNVKVLMRVTAKDDREEIGNTMDLNEEQMHQVINFKTGHAYLYHEGEDRVRTIRMVNFKGEHRVEEPPSDEELTELMSSYQREHADLYLPFAECGGHCQVCDRRVRNQAESFVRGLFAGGETDIYRQAFVGEDAAMIEQMQSRIGICPLGLLLSKQEAERIRERYAQVGEAFGYCTYLHLLHRQEAQMQACSRRQKKCSCSPQKWAVYLGKYAETADRDSEKENH